MKFRPAVTFVGPVRTLVSSAVAPDLLAVLGEALSNISKHAGASTVEVQLEAGTEVALTVVDDGRGLPDNLVEGGLGNIRQRAERHRGRLEVVSSPGKAPAWSGLCRSRATDAAVERSRQQRLRGFSRESSTAGQGHRVSQRHRGRTSGKCRTYVPAPVAPAV